MRFNVLSVTLLASTAFASNDVHARNVNNEKRDPQLQGPLELLSGLESGLLSALPPQLAALLPIAPKGAAPKGASAPKGKASPKGLTPPKAPPRPKGSAGTNSTTRLNSVKELITTIMDFR
jgi:hypothetical protein